MSRINRAPNRPHRVVTPGRDTTILGEIASAAFELPMTLPAELLHTSTPGNSGPDTVTFDAVRVAMARTSTPASVKDAVWRRIAGHARRDRPWRLYAAGLACPGLRGGAAKMVRAGWEPGEAHAAIVAAFMTALRDTNTGRPRLAGRLVDAAYEHASERKRQHITHIYVPDFAGLTDEPEAPDVHTSGNSLVILERITASGALSKDQHELIARTYLGGQTLKHAAAELGIPQSTASRARAAAAAIIAQRLQPAANTPNPTPAPPAA